MDDAKADALPRRTVKVPFQGTSQDAKDVDVVRCQATAVFLALLQADGGKAAAKLGRLLEEYLKRDSLPDLDKAMGWKKGRALEEARRLVE
jgi:hypothetical protein